MGEFNVGMTTSRTYEWGTPQWLFDQLDAEFHFALDPCATSVNAKCDRYFTIEDDGLSQTWTGGPVYMNPPYGRGIDQWMRKAWETHLAGEVVVCLVPARTDTAWWHDYAAKGAVRFLRGRLMFDGEAERGHNAPFPSAVVVFG